MINMKLLAVVTPPSIYHGCYAWKIFLEEKFTGKKKFTIGELSDVNMRNVFVAMLGNTDISRIVTSMAH